jgi:hypothetical protein
MVYQSLAIHSQYDWTHAVAYGAGRFWQLRSRPARRR